MRLAAVVLLWVASAGAQEELTVNRLAESDLAPGASHSYAIALHAGDYVAGVLDQGDSGVGVEVSLPDGSRLREFPGTRSGKRRFAFIASAAGKYRIDLKRPPRSAAGKYGLRLTEILALDERMKPEPLRDKYSNSKIEGLRKQIAGGLTRTEAFWKTVAAEGTPLVEDAPGDTKYQLVTFLWRGSPDTRNVFVAFFPFAAARMEDYLMRRIAETDVWYVTVKLPRGARFAYTLSPNDPLTFSGARSLQRIATSQADPLNPHRWNCAPGADKFECLSSAELPGAVPQPWLVKNADTPEGKIGRHRIKSELLKNERNISVYTPAGYRLDGAPYPLLVVFDESAYLSLIPTPVILDNLIAAGRIPPMVAVLIANPSQESRNKELPPNPYFADFLAKELVPMMHDHFNVTSDPRLTIVAGSSYGGIAAMYAGLRHSEIFGNVLCQSGSFWWAPERAQPEKLVDSSIEGGWLAKQFINSRKLPLKFYMVAGWFEVDMNGTGIGILEPSRHMRDVLLALGYEVHYQESVGGHDYLSWRGTLADGLIALIGK